MLEKPKVVAIVPARMTSTRLPAKVMKPILGRLALGLMLERVRRTPGLDEVVVATTVDESSQPICDLAERLGFTIFRGSESDVLGRTVGAATAVGADVIVDVSSDCILCDPVVIQQCIDAYLVGDCDYVSNGLIRTYPLGMDVQVYSARLLAEVERRTQDPLHREHVSLYIYQHPHRYRLKNLEAPAELTVPHLSLVLDTADDLALLTAIYEGLYPHNPSFSLADVLRFLRARPGLPANAQAVPRPHTVSQYFSERRRNHRTTALRAALIGCGEIAGGLDERSSWDTILTHVKAYLDRDDVEVVGVADPDVVRAEAFARKWEIPMVFRTAEELLAETKPDLVSICSPNEFHAKLLALCLNYPIKAVWCEKPLAEDAEAVRDVIEEFQRRGIPCAVNYQRRWMDQAQLVRARILRGDLGTILHISGYYTKGLRHNGSHTLDLWRYWFGEPTSAVAVAAGPKDKTGDRTVTAQLEFDGKVSACLVGLGLPGYSLWEVDVLGTARRVHFRNNGLDVDWYEVESSSTYRGHKELSTRPLRVQSNLGNVMRRILADLMNAVETRAPLSSDGVSALKTLNLCNDLLKQSERLPV